MKIIKDYISPNEYSRPVKKLSAVKALVMHWTGAPQQKAVDTRDFFENKKTGMGGYSSAHYIVDLNGDILAVVPESEVAYHCGTMRTDPESKKIYTDYARSKFGAYASEYSSPNNCTIGIELCTTDIDGHFTTSTITAAVELCADLCKRYRLKVTDITTHHSIVGWKDCPRLWTNEPNLFEAFKSSVQDYISRGKV